MVSLQNTTTSLPSLYFVLTSNNHYNLNDNVVIERPRHFQYFLSHNEYCFYFIIITITVNYQLSLFLIRNGFSRKTCFEQAVEVVALRFGK